MKTITIKKLSFNVNKIKSIEKFNNKLQKVKEPFSVSFDFPIAEIPPYLFSFTKLAKITLPDSIIEINNYAFDQCPYLKEIILPDSIDSINMFAFHGCSTLIKMTIPNSVRTIFSYAFAHCTSLAEITLPNSILEIDSNAFENCYSLKEITIPPSIKFLGHHIFAECTLLQKITIQMPKEDFFKSVVGAKEFYYSYTNLISFENTKSLDSLLSKNDSIESIINTLEPER